MEKASPLLSPYSVDRPSYPLSPAIWSSVMMAIAGMGDALLYAWLPAEGFNLGLSVFMIGLLLSINKFIRLFANRWIAFIAEKTDIKFLLVAGVLLAGTTTFIYALNPLVWVWILSRIIWGISYSALRFSAIQYAGKSSRTGSALGISRSIRETGPVLIYWTGPLLISTFSPAFTFSIIGIATMALLPLFYLLPDLKSGSQIIRPMKFELPGKTELWVSVSSFAVEGLLVVGISGIIDLESSDPEHLLQTSALYISSRRFLNIIISPLSGWVTERWKSIRVFNLSCLFIISGLLLIVFHYPGSGIFIVFLGSAMNTTLVPYIALKLTPPEKKFDAYTKLSTSGDIGSALGALFGLFLLSVFDNGLIFATLSILLAAIWNYLPKLDMNHDGN